MLALSEKFRPIVTLALALLVIAIAVPERGLAQGGGARVYLSPATTSTSAGQQFTVEVIAEGMASLYAEEIRLRFDPQVLAVLDADPQQEGVQLEAGPFLDPQHGFVVANKADNSEGTALFAMTLVNPAPPAQGSGVLARVSFKALQPGTTEIQLEKALLVNDSVKAIETSTAGAQAQILGQAPAATALPAPGPAPAPSAPDNAVLSNLLGPLFLVVVIVGLVVTSVFLRPYLRRPAQQQDSRAARQRVFQPRQLAAPPGKPAGQVTTLLEQARMTLEKGDRTAAYHYYSLAVEAAPDSERAWLGKAQTTRSFTERRLCLMRVLTINPGSRQAQAELESLNKARGGVRR
jgi:hypothetical protein